MSPFRSLKTTRRKSGRHRQVCIEPLEQRLALTWAGVPPVSVTLPSSAVAVTLNAQSNAAGNASIASTEVDYYSFTATTNGTYVISATTPTSSLDTVLGLFSASGQRLAYNDDISSTNRDSRIGVNLVAGTRYYVGITNYSSSSRGTYTWTIAGPAPALADDPYEDNDTQATAFNLGTLTATSTISQLVMADSQDWFKFTTAAVGTSAHSVSISFQNSAGNLQLALYNSSGTLIGSSLGTGNSETISLNGLAAGTYSVRVYGNNGALNPNYSLTINPPAAPIGTIPPVAPFPDVPYYGGANDWNLNAINAPEVWAQGYTGAGVVVAVVDTGVDWDHPELLSQIWVNPGEIPNNGIDDDHNGFVDDVRGWDFVGNDNNPDDANGHGTHVAGTIAASDNGVGSTGVAPGATIMPVRVLDANGSGSWAAVASGIRYAAQNGANIINLSLGGGSSSLIQSAIAFAQSLDVLVVVAAGNESASAPSYPARYSASMNNVLSVGAHSSTNAIASFSNRVGASGAVQVDAPGVNVYSTYFNAGYATLSGTSMATPHVAGLAALTLSANPTLTASQLRTLIVNGANRNISGSDSKGGVNAALTVALAAAGQTSTSTTAATSAQSSSAGPITSLRRLALLAAPGGSSAAAPLEIGCSIASPEPAASIRSSEGSASDSGITAMTVDHVLGSVVESRPDEFNPETSDLNLREASAQLLGETFAGQDDWTCEPWQDSELAAGVI